MNKLITALAPAAIVLAASLGCGAAYAADSNTTASGLVVAQAQTLPASQSSGSAAMQHALTRKDVYNQLVQAQKDGTINRMNAIYYGTYFGS
jgi:2-polyprenyl-6-methoxyphenol hydroxylase-like FAD-dependent oxidoreductase